MGSTDPQFGRLIVKRRGSAGLALSLAALSFVPAMLFVMIVTGNGTGGGPVEITVFGAIALAMWFAVWKCAKNPLTVLYLFERGLRKSGPGGTVELRYDEVTNLQFKVVRQYLNFAYSGSEIRLRIESASHPAIKLVARFEETPKAAFLSYFSSKGFETTDLLEELPNRVALATAARAFRELGHRR